jgi:hypothetical protein
LLKWVETKNEVESLFRKANQNLQENYSSIVTMCENLMVSAPRKIAKPFKSLTHDMQLLESLSRSTEQTYSQTIAPLGANCKLIELIA